MFLTKKKYLILGKDGQLGHEFEKIINSDNFVSFGHLDLDITEFYRVKEKIKEIEPEIIINCIAYNNVNGAEENAEIANLINGEAISNLAKICREFGITLVHFSTDYVFNGNNVMGYSEVSQPNPINNYGRSKLLGEEMLIDAMEADYNFEDIPDGKYFIIRTSYLFSKNGHNIVNTFRKFIEDKKELTVIEDQKVCLTYASDLAKQVYWLLETNEYENGIYHITNEGILDWAEFISFLGDILGIDDIKITFIKLNDWKVPARRPLNSVLINTKLPKLRNWKETIKDYLNIN